MAKELMDYFEDEESESSEMVESKTTIGIEGLVGVLFRARNDAHLAHLLQADKTLARHLAFSDFYNGVLELIDALCESYMGRYTVTSLSVPASKPITEPISYFNNLYDLVTIVRSGQKDGYIINQLDGLQELIASVLYKFKNITT